jgi:inner membrane protein
LEKESVDNICHTLVGAAMGEAGLKGKTRFGTAALLIGANLPDLDVLVFATSTPSIEFRRGWTHGVLAQLVLPVLFTGVLWLLGRMRPRDAGPPLRPAWLLLLSYAGVWSHVFLDYLNTYGIRLLTPFDWQWFYGDAVFIIDPWLWLMLGAGVWLARRRGRMRPVLSARAVSQTRPALAALLAAVCYVAAMIVLARTGRATVVEAWRQMHGSEPRALMVGPVPLRPFTKEVIVDAGEYYQRGRLTWPASVVFDPDVIPKHDDGADVASARESPGIRSFLVWSRFPYWTVEQDGGSVRVTVADVRFMAGGRVFSASTRLPGQSGSQ